MKRGFLLGRSSSPRSPPRTISAAAASNAADAVDNNNNDESVSPSSPSKTTPASACPLKKCGLCGRTPKHQKLMRTPCCHQWICDDEDQYVIGTYARNSCARNHMRYTLCGSHYCNQHRGKDWKKCEECRHQEPEMYVWYGTNHYNFEKLPHPPRYEPTRCKHCNRIVRLSSDDFVRYPCGSIFCESCPMPMSLMDGLSHGHIPMHVRMKAIDEKERIS